VVGWIAGGLAALGVVIEYFVKLVKRMSEVEIPTE
jgi:hypothetical protein